MTSETRAAGSKLEPAPTGLHTFGDWLTVQETVAYCLSKGLSRTPKTVRKWALRSQIAENGSAEIVAKAQDTENGYRWLIERVSLDVKIAQELEFDARRSVEAAQSNPSEPVPTGANEDREVLVNERKEEPVETGLHLSAPLPTSAASDPEYLKLLVMQLDRAHAQLDVKDRQIEALLERDRETNILIQGLQTSLTKVAEALPDGNRDRRDAA